MSTSELFEIYNQQTNSSDCNHTGSYSEYMEYSDYIEHDSWNDWGTYAEADIPSHDDCYQDTDSDY